MLSSSTQSTKPTTVQSENDRLTEEFITQIEPEIKRRHRLLMPVIYMEVKTDWIYFVKEDIEQFFRTFGEVKYIELRERCFYVNFKYFFSAVFAYRVLNEIVHTEELFDADIKLLRDEEDPKPKEAVKPRGYCYFDDPTSKNSIPSYEYVKPGNLYEDFCFGDTAKEHLACGYKESLQGEESLVDQPKRVSI